MIDVKITHTLDKNDIENLLSGMRMSHYWCENAGDFDLISTQQKITDGGTHIAKEYDESNGKIIGRYPVNLKTLKKGLERMGSEYPKHYADVVNENDDADTADVLLQLSTIGELRYG